MRTEGFAVTLERRGKNRRKPTRPDPAGEQTMTETSGNKTTVGAETRDGIQLTSEYQTSGFNSILQGAKASHVPSHVSNHSIACFHLSMRLTGAWRLHPVKLQERKQLSLPSLTGSFITVVGVHRGMQRNLAGHDEDSPGSEFPKTVSRAIFSTQSAGASGGLQEQLFCLTPF